MKTSLFDAAYRLYKTWFYFFRDSALQVFACDYSDVAIDLLKKNPTYSQFEKQITAFVCDISDSDLVRKKFEESGITEGSLDLLTLVFVLSAIRPEKHQETAATLSSYVKPGGTLLFRDYCQMDMAQLRFKAGQCLDSNLYLRKDGTTSYFFKISEVENLFPESIFEKKFLFEDRRLIVNRKRKLQMFRSWIQGRFIKK